MIADMRERRILVGWVREGDGSRREGQVDGELNESLKVEGRSSQKWRLRSRR